jgi:hypothetical protein
MSPDKQQLVRERIQLAGKALEGKLPPSSRHPKGRNPYAHIAKVIISTLGSSYKELPDGDYEAVLLVIQHCEQNPF